MDLFMAIIDKKFYFAHDQYERDCLYVQSTFTKPSNLLYLLYLFSILLVR